MGEDESEEQSPEFLKEIESAAFNAPQREVCKRPSVADPYSLLTPLHKRPAVECASASSLPSLPRNRPAAAPTTLIKRPAAAPPTPPTSRAASAALKRPAAAPADSDSVRQELYGLVASPARLMNLYDEKRARLVYSYERGQGINKIMVGGK